jgi:hypothetical protein
LFVQDFSQVTSSPAYNLTAILYPYAEFISVDTLKFKFLIAGHTLFSSLDLLNTGRPQLPASKSTSFASLSPNYCMNLLTALLLLCFYPDDVFVSTA